MVNILLVDDHIIFRKSLSRLFKTYGKLNVVGEASNGKEALEFLKKNKADVVVLDINMPVMDGLECAEKIKENFPLVKVLILTMHESYEIIKKALMLGVSGFFIKSVEPDSLIDAIQKISKGSEVFQEEVLKLVIAGIRNEASKKSRPQVSSQLSEREIEILKFISEGLTTFQIAENLGISKHTIDAHRKNMVRKIGAKNTTELVQHYLRESKK
jgi:DNA-binding NarL/FixJ family response regulator